jgi:hypothetical protein
MNLPQVHLNRYSHGVLAGCRKKGCVLKILRISEDPLNILVDCNA